MSPTAVRIVSSNPHSLHTPAVGYRVCTNLMSPTAVCTVSPNPHSLYTPTVGYRVCTTLSTLPQWGTAYAQIKCLPLQSAQSVQTHTLSTLPQCGTAYAQIKCLPLQSAQSVQTHTLSTLPQWGTACAQLSPHSHSGVPRMHKLNAPLPLLSMMGSQKFPLLSLEKARIQLCVLYLLTGILPKFCLTVSFHFILFESPSSRIKCRVPRTVNGTFTSDSNGLNMF